MMNSNQSRKFEMLTRVRDFGASNPTAFPADSHAAELLASVSAAVDELSGSSAAQAAGTDIARAGTANRHLSREALTDDLEKISRTAKAIARRVPGLEGKFQLRTNVRAQVLVDTARAFAAEAAQFKAQFARLALGDAFFAKLEADIGAFDGALGAQRRGRETRMVASATIASTLAEGVAAVKELDALVRNHFESDDVALAAWESASRLHKGRLPGRPRKASIPPEPQAA